MSFNTTFAWIEYQDALIYFKTGDWILENPVDLVLGHRLKNGLLILFENSQSLNFYKSLLKYSPTTIHKFIEKQTHLIQVSGQFQLTLDRSEVDYKIYKTNHKIFESERNYHSLRNEIVDLLSKFNDSSVQSVIFSELCYENPLHVQLYIELYIESILGFIQVNKERSLNRYTIFINEVNKECFLKAAHNQRIKFICYSFIR